MQGPFTIKPEQVGGTSRVDTKQCMNRFLCRYIYTVDHCSHVRIYFAMDIDSDGLRVIEMLD